MESWKVIPNRGGRYEASTDGRIRSVSRAYTTKNGVAKRVIGKIIATDVNPANGYVQSALDNKRVNVHRVIAATFLGEPNGLEVNHIDGNKQNNSASNLEYVTRSENVTHRYRVLKKSAGENHPMAKIRRDDVDAIKELRLNGATYVSIGREFGISESQARRIVSGKGWSNV